MPDKINLEVKKKNDADHAIRMKNKKHIQIWKKENEALKELRQKLEAKEPVRDEEIKRTIKLIKSSQVEE